MGPETVKVYKGDEVITINKTEVKLWNKSGYYTSSQQKKRAAGEENPEEPETIIGDEPNDEGTGTTEENTDAISEGGEGEASEENTNPENEDTTEVQTEQDGG